MWHYGLKLIMVVGLVGALLLPSQDRSVLAQGEKQISVLAFVIQSNDMAQVRRAEWTEFTHLSLGAGLEQGDLIDPKGKSVRVICGDLSTYVVVTLGPVPCPKERSIVKQDKAAFAGWQRGKRADPTIPYLISPRGSLVATMNPAILWNPVADADSYRVTVRGEKLNWSAIVKGSKTHTFTYPKDAPALMAAVAYSIEINALAQGAMLSSSSEEDASGTSFTIMNGDQIVEIQHVIEKVRSGIADKNIATLIVAQVYSDQRLFADALDLLLPLIQSNGQTGQSIRSDLLTSPVPQLVLGNIYLATHLELEAQTVYRRALKLAQDLNDLESQALALTSLARLSIAPDERAKFAAQAVDAWNALGATSQADLTAKEFSQDGSK